ncbi:MAG: hypothetical protein D6737_00310 [Chloroflexi bacterium]|nr:MAG: hypothetical protein D6737_00310 [Chloroflexota bacterium]
MWHSKTKSIDAVDVAAKRENIISIGDVFTSYGNGNFQVTASSSAHTFMGKYPAHHAVWLEVDKIAAEIDDNPTMYAGMDDDWFAELRGSWDDRLAGIYGSEEGQ